MSHYMYMCTDHCMYTHRVLFMYVGDEPAGTHLKKNDRNV